MGVREMGMSTVWDARFMVLATAVASWSKDPSTKVGAVIADRKKRVVGIGYNGFPRGVSDNPERYAHRPTKYKLIVHSETNAILNAVTRLDGCTIYATKFPCSDCSKLIVQSGITRVVAPGPLPGEVWTDDAEFSKIMFLESDVDIVVYG